ncbi:SDR family NAD(P)-dependent oxidoreductase [Comamonas endophytica]|uniref:SDR family NAD(P)-dependent oxidoreductase n=1 Tax=Comamonas endophytica TaxID=2949090 RepID=A0ABY6GA60_9BURK|nr:MULTISPECIES: SDR family NAD(P)-dependent oxidoreductase [unclassified Acidovorax]MCD2512033.1 SDR family NAD(P)-dependent oxidoreductase [Acidovorax sp. D4N7]UYG51813.1 SDR family NAD(P)-dependent oxidoreductase [Acidovorax sp. 5MLIR]
MTSHLIFLTGGSRGMGLAMARQLLHPDHELICLSRNQNEALAEAAAAASAPLQQWSVDLGAPAEAAVQLGDWLRQQPSGRFAQATLINNAGAMPAIAPLSSLTSAELSPALRVGFEAPMLLTAAFLGATEHWPAERKVLNISSGLGRRPMASQAAYCAAKAGLDHFTRCVALEESLKPHGAKLCSLAPGVIDTDMQIQLRNADPAAFPDLQRFADLKSHDQLASPEQAARQVLAWLERADFGEQPVADIRQP